MQSLSCFDSGCTRRGAANPRLSVVFMKYRQRERARQREKLIKSILFTQLDDEIRFISVTIYNFFSVFIMQPITMDDKQAKNQHLDFLFILIHNVVKKSKSINNATR